MRVLALDIGEKRVGIASGDTSVGVATPLCVLPYAEVISNASTFRRIVDDHEPELIICGRPLTLSGEQGPQAERIEQAAKVISNSLGIPVDFEDERLSSAEAKRVLREQGYSEKQMRGKIDCLAASLILESWMRRTFASTLGEA